MPKLPRDVSEYLDSALRSINWDKLNGSTPDLCKACPQSSREINADDPVCLACPWWGVLYSHMQAQHWHGHHHSKRIAKSQEDALHHD